MEDSAPASVTISQASLRRLDFLAAIGLNVIVGGMTPYQAQILAMSTDYDAESCVAALEEAKPLLGFGPQEDTAEKQAFIDSVLGVN